MQSRKEKITDHPEMLDSLAVEIFTQEYDWETLKKLYMQSGKHSGKASKSAGNKDILPDEHVNNWEELGANEKYLTSKIYSDPSPIYIVGSIGSGKSAFLRFFANQIHANKNHPCNKDCKKKHDALLIDFSKNDPLEFKGWDEQKIDVAFIKLLLIPLKEFISVFLKHVKDEITEVWDYWKENIEEEPHVKEVTIPSFIRGKLRDKKADDWDDATFDVIISKREEILEEIRQDSVNYLDYLIAVIEYIQKRYFHTEKRCIILIIDNIDKLYTIVQHIVIDRLNTICNKSGRVKIVTSIRNGTFENHVFKFQHVFDKIINSGPKPIDIVIDRIRKFLNYPHEYKASRTLSKDDLNIVCNFLHFVIKRLKISPLLKSVFSAFCGDNIRISLILAQYFLVSIIYRLENYKTITDNDLIRTFIIKTNKDYKFEWSEREQIENIFCTHKHWQKSYFLKPRLLKLLNDCVGAEGIAIKKLVYILRRFNYSVTEISHALWEMSLDTKGLIWNTSCLTFNNPNGLLMSKDTIVHISEIGVGYFKTLMNCIDYIQEMAYDTPISDEDYKLPQNRKFPLLDKNDILERLGAVFALLNCLLKREVEDIKIYLNRRSRKEYLDYFKSKELIVSEIISYCYSSAIKILDIRDYILRDRFGEDNKYYKKFVNLKEERINYFTFIKRIADSININNLENIPPLHPIPLDSIVK